MQSGKEKATLDVTWSEGSYQSRQLRSPTFSPDGKLISVEDTEGIGLFAVGTGKRLATIEGAQAPFVFSRDGKTLTALVRTGQGTKAETTIKVWELTWEKEPGK